MYKCLYSYTISPAPLTLHTPIKEKRITLDKITIDEGKKNYCALDQGFPRYGHKPFILNEVELSKNFHNCHIAAFSVHDKSKSFRENLKRVKTCVVCSSFYLVVCQS